MTARNQKNPPDELSTWMSTNKAFNHGTNMTDAEAKVLEEKLSNHAEDLKSRIKLHTYYIYKANNQSEALRHWLGVIENNPEIDPLTAQSLQGLHYGEASHQKIIDAWLEQVKLHPANPKVLRNAGLYIKDHDIDAAIELLTRALHLAPGDIIIRSALADQTLDASRSDITPRETDFRNHQ